MSLVTFVTSVFKARIQHCAEPVDWAPCSCSRYPMGAGRKKSRSQHAFAANWSYNFQMELTIRSLAKNFANFVGFLAIWNLSFFIQQKQLILVVFSTFSVFFSTSLVSAAEAAFLKLSSCPERPFLSFFSWKSHFFGTFSVRINFFASFPKKTAKRRRKCTPLQKGFAIRLLFQVP